MNVTKCAVVVCNEDEGFRVTFKWKWGEHELSIADQYTHLGIEISKDCSWDVHIVKVIGKVKTHVGKMDAIPTGSHPDTRIKTCIVINVTVPKLEHAQVWEENAKSVTRLETVQMTAAKKVQDAQARRVSTTSTKSRTGNV